MPVICSIRTNCCPYYYYYLYILFQVCFNGFLTGLITSTLPLSQICSPQSSQKVKNSDPIMSRSCLRPFLHHCSPVVLRIKPKPQLLAMVWKEGPAGFGIAPSAAVLPPPHLLCSSPTVLLAVPWASCACSCLVPQSHGSSSSKFSLAPQSQWLTWHL